MCLSGGGYRAAAFHLGALYTLDELGLLDNVKIMSTASGGTIMAAAYAYSKAKGLDFSEFYTFFVKFLMVNTIAEALQIAITEQTQNPSKEISLISCAARVYQKKIFDEIDKLAKEKQERNGVQHKDEKKDFGIFLDDDLNPFDDLIFNVTELRLGNSFRFRASQSKGAAIGSGTFRIDPEVAAKIKLGDIAAASSCFPGAFDPFTYPDDFNFEKDDDKKTEVSGAVVSKTGEKISIPLMDGGIFDNQGVYGVELSNLTGAPKREAGEDNDEANPNENSAILQIAVEDHSVDLIVISDSNPLKKDLYPLPQKLRKVYPDPPKTLPLIRRDYTRISLLNASEQLIDRFRWWTIWAITGALVLGGIGLLSFTYLSAFIYQYHQMVFADRWSAIFVGIVPWGLVLTLLALSVAALFCLFKGRKILSRAEDFVEKLDELELNGYPRFRVWSLVKEANLSSVIKLIESRLNSTLALTTDLFLKRIRDLGVKGIKANPNLSHLVAFNYITDINFDINIKKRKFFDDKMKPTPSIVDKMNKACEYPTNLWYTEPGKLEAVIEGGRISICYSLLVHLWDMWKAEKALLDAQSDPKRTGENEKDPPKPNPADKELYENLMKQWNSFK